MSLSDFPVGSVVYFLHNKTERVLPAQVHEKIVRTSMNGSKSTYIVKVRAKSKAPNADGFTMLELDPDSVNVYQTADEMKQFMIERASAAVTNLVEAAVTASSVFGDVAPRPQPVDPDPAAEEEDYESWHVPAAERPIKGSKKEKSEYAEVDLGDGRKARLKV